MSAARGERAALLSPNPGAPLLAISVFDDATSLWTTTVIDGATGEVRAQVPDLLVIGPRSSTRTRRPPRSWPSRARGGRRPASAHCTRSAGIRAPRRSTRSGPRRTLRPSSAATPPPRPTGPSTSATPWPSRRARSSCATIRSRQAAIRLESVAADGSVFTFDVTGEPSGADVACEGACRLAVALTDGRVGLFDAALTLLNPAPDAGGDPRSRLRRAPTRSCPPSAPPATP